MTPAEWQRIKAVAIAAWIQPPAERAAYAAWACDGDEALHAEVQLLLKSMTDATELFEAPSVALPGRRPSAIRQTHN
jgi:hypothetical protein